MVQIERRYGIVQKSTCVPTGLGTVPKVTYDLIQEHETLPCAIGTDEPGRFESLPNGNHHDARALPAGRLAHPPETPEQDHGGQQ